MTRSLPFRSWSEVMRPPSRQCHRNATRAFLPNSCQTEGLRQGPFAASPMMLLKCERRDLNPHGLRHRNLNPKLVARSSHRGDAGVMLKSLLGKPVRKSACPRGILPGLGWHGQSRYLSVTSGGRSASLPVCRPIFTTLPVCQLATKQPASTWTRRASGPPICHFF